LSNLSRCLLDFFESLLSLCIGKLELVLHVLFQGCDFLGTLLLLRLDDGLDFLKVRLSFVGSGLEVVEISEVALLVSLQFKLELVLLGSLHLLTSLHGLVELGRPLLGDSDSVLKSLLAELFSLLHLVLVFFADLLKLFDLLVGLSHVGLFHLFIGKTCSFFRKLFLAEVFSSLELGLDLLDGSGHALSLEELLCNRWTPGRRTLLLLDLDVKCNWGFVLIAHLVRYV